jgi:hypothetical protein
MYTAYYDDSGSPDDTLAVVVAGFVASDEQWVEFERNWNDTLRQFGITLFHMREFAHSLGEFSRFKHEKEARELFLRKLMADIVLRVCHACGHAVLMNDYRAVNAVYALDGRFGLTPYALCGRTCVRSVSDWAHRRGVSENQIRHVFEDGSSGKRTLEHRILRDKDIVPVFKKKHECVPLQAADLLAYEVLGGNRSIYAKGVASFEDLRYPMKQLSKIIEMEKDLGTYTQDGLEQLCVNAKIPRRDFAQVKAAGS